jgi:cytidine deaminase
VNSFRKGNLSPAEITQWLLDLRAHSSTPESGFNVSGVFRAKLGGVEDYYFGGVNVENTDHRLSTHGEEGGMAGILTGLGKHGEIVEGWVMGAPRDVTPHDGSHFAAAFISCCGKCRQQIAGIAGDAVKIHSVSINGEVQSTTVDEFLPDKFSFRQFIPEISVTANSTVSAPSAAEVESRLMRATPQTAGQIRDWLQSLESIDYVTKISQSAVVRLDNDCYVAGTRMEEAAFQSMNAAQAALAVATTEFGARLVQEVWVYTRGRDDKALPPDAYGTLPLSALQIFFQFAANKAIPVHFLNDSLQPLTMSLLQAAEVAPTSRQPYYQKNRP